MSALQEQIRNKSTFLVAGLRSLDVRGVLLILLVLDAVFILVHAGVRLNIGDENAPQNLHLKRFLITHDGSYSEFYEYLKSALCAVGFTVLAWRRRQNAYAALAFLFAFITLDNAVRIHEQAGHWIGAYVPYGNNMGDLVVLGCLGFLIAFILWLTFPGEGDPERPFVSMAILLLALFGFFAAGMDAANAVFSHFIPASRILFAILEDGGELVALSFNLALAWSLVRMKPSRAGRVERQAARIAAGAGGSIVATAPERPTASAGKVRGG